ncbi:MAG: Gfo/Idh/MocA family oxidoreductase [Actinomycetota bacterium]|nr:Gfo/Idh/MocA family oxidoreductase [Actinomycetota bacterium]
MTPSGFEERATRFAAVGLRHPHGESMTEALLDAGGELVAYVEDDDELASEFEDGFSGLRRARSIDEILQDGTVDLVVSAAVPRDRSGIAVAAMEHGKDVLLDKPACTNAGQVDALREAAVATGRHLAVWFDERIDNPAALAAVELIERGAVGEVLHVIGTGPHELDLFPRPEWFYSPELAGGILVDLGCQQIELFLTLSDSSDATVEFARVGNVAHRERPEFQDVGDAVLRGSAGAMGYLRVDWFTPSGLGAFGDGRTLVVGTEGTLELRRDIDPCGRGEGHHLFLADGKDSRYIAVEEGPSPFARMLISDVAMRTETTMTTEHALRVTELSLEAQALAMALRDREASS